MKIFISGNSHRVNELRKIIPKEHDFFIHDEEKEFPLLDDFDILIDLNLDDYSNHLQHYAALKGKLIIGCAVKKTLQAMATEYNGQLLCTLVGINALPTFINRNVIEVSFLNKKDESLAEEQLKLLGWNFVAVADQTGMVTPRIIFMVINEAFFTVYNGIASIEDIDKGMKLGTAYPLGPFEWAYKIGIKDIYETLDAIYKTTQDERYRICPLLKEKYTLKENYTSAGI